MSVRTPADGGSTERRQCTNLLVKTPSLSARDSTTVLLVTSSSRLAGWPWSPSCRFHRYVEFAVCHLFGELRSATHVYLVDQRPPSQRPLGDEAESRCWAVDPAAPRLAVLSTSFVAPHTGRDG